MTLPFVVGEVAARGLTGKGCEACRMERKPDDTVRVVPTPAREDQMGSIGAEGNMILRRLGLTTTVSGGEVPDRDTASGHLHREGQPVRREVEILDEPREASARTSSPSACADNTLVTPSSQLTATLLPRPSTATQVAAVGRATRHIFSTESVIW
ncbi:hypothetical protein SMD44_08158 [Streptomyces alboflavus]|uniref:Uncharacterized protein n=1 Tax=Streptomyces alboflavus TaxID=67267 RepID=A0A1Z1WQD1_9ACTN|nr:hypothetical protein [Streptomyces alboflavus]ARX88671.1 hypothetical protein SMD44_08158 [Streptomyces alboflavus]